MSNLAEQLSDYGTSLKYADLPSDVVHLAKRFIIDTIGCALGGYDSEPSKVARAVAGEVTPAHPVTVMGSGQSSSLDLAVFANGVMIRFLDFNDGYTSQESGHPSDSIAAALSATEAAGGSGKRLLVSTVLAYEAFCRICDTVDIKPRGFDHVTVGGIASVLAAARAMKLSKEQTFQALNLGIASNVALYQTRIGDVSMWKGCAYANASRNAVFSVQLARAGLTGPSPIFEGDGGYFRAVSGEPFALKEMGGKDHPFKINECSIKQFPLGQYSQTVAQAALEVRELYGQPEEIAQVNISTLQTAVNIMAGDPEKWTPKNRETADHSMPYTAAVALMFGTVESRHFDDEFLKDPDLLELVSKVTVSVSNEANARAPEAMLCDFEVVTKSGEEHSVQVAYHKGHYRNPLTDNEVDRKFRSLAQEHLSAERVDALLDRLWHLEDVQNVGDLIRLTVF
ncbi:MAG: MmgE/PrpD family protein [SAR202 cluster bacterium]|nr:MmgE/PrpD family protein [SAR202 cluster bacterium]|tara:strand:+ start:1421 stop:2782 length:1362 start_codon:yes stop_codon:yes gene_type:complete